MDAYSPSNLGDAELVSRTLQYCAERYGDDYVVLATDPEGFSSDSDIFYGEFDYMPLSKVRLLQRPTRIGRTMWLVSELVTVLVGLAASSTPIRVQYKRRILKFLGVLLRKAWLRAISEADHIIAVGGGYLGDAYWRRTITSCAIYATAANIGSSVETMPMSVSGADTRSVRFALRYLGRDVFWRAREPITASILRSVKLDVREVPDLAWLNATRFPSSSGGDRAGIAICPVGSQFYSTDNSALEAEIFAALANLPAATSITMIPMHRYDEKLEDGMDDSRCEDIMDRIKKIYPTMTVKIRSISSYPELIEAMKLFELSFCERLHAALASVCAGTPAVVVGYEPKHGGVLKMANLDGFLGSRINQTWTPLTNEEILKRACAQRVRVSEELFAETTSR